MMPTISQIIEYPRYSCEACMLKHSLESGNTIVATYWTDGRIDNPVPPL